MRDQKPPSQRKVGARIRVKEDKADAASTAFQEAGFTPIYVEHRDDGAVSFWFGKDVETYRVATAIPREWYAVAGIVR
jgi:hypothetical protein